MYIRKKKLRQISNLALAFLTATLLMFVIAKAILGNQ